MKRTFAEVEYPRIFPKFGYHFTKDLERTLNARGERFAYSQLRVWKSGGGLPSMKAFLSVVQILGLSEYEISLSLVEMRRIVDRQECEEEDRAPKRNKKKLPE